MNEQTDRLIDVLLWEQIGCAWIPDVTEKVLTRAFRRRRRVWVRVAAVAALVVVCVLAGWRVMGRRYPAPEASGSYKVLGAAEVRRGAVVVTERLPASLALGGYCQVRLDPSTTLRIGGKAGSEEVFLERGGVKCEVNRGAGAFAVHSPVGSVSVTGTSFSVALLEREKGKIVVGSRKAVLMAVAVTAGSVSVDYNGGIFRLSAGAQQVFGEEAGARPNQPAPAPAPAANTARVAGQLTKIDGKALTITTDGKDTVITCNDTTKFSRDGAGPVKFEYLQVGQPVRAYYTKGDNVAVAVIIAKPPAGK